MAHWRDKQQRVVLSQPSPKPGFTVSKSPTPNQAIDVGSYLSSGSTINNSHCPCNPSPSSLLVLCDLDIYAAEQEDGVRTQQVCRLRSYTYFYAGFSEIRSTFPSVLPGQRIHRNNVQYRDTWMRPPPTISCTHQFNHSFIGDSF